MHTISRNFSLLAVYTAVDPINRLTTQPTVYPTVDATTKCATCTDERIPRLTTPQAGVGDFADEARGTVRAADQRVPQLVVAVDHAKAVHETQTFRGIRLQTRDA